MLGWRRRNDGFEWREYVRTTILVRRKKRRDRIGEAGKAAVENIKVAGQRGAVAGAEGAMAVGRGAARAGRQGARVGAAGAKAFGRGAMQLAHKGAVLGAAGARSGAGRVRRSIPVIAAYLQRFGAAVLAAAAYTWAVLRTLAGLAADYLGPPLAPAGRFLRQRGIRLAVFLAGSVALLGGILRANANGFERDTWIALLVGIGLLAALLAAHGLSALPQRLTQPLRSAGTAVGERFSALAGRPATHLGVGIAMLALVIVGGISWLSAGDGTIETTAGAMRPDRGTAARIPTAPTDGSAVAGRARAISGDRLRVGTTTVILTGIEAPLPNQTCPDAADKEWNCGQAAREALARLVRGRRVSCGVASGVGRCRIGDTDIGAELVERGHVFAASGLFAAYGSEERAARAAGAGIWAGDALRPADYRAQRWEEAKRAAPDGCPIKGSVRSGRRYYLVPWARGYERARVVQSRGGRWFCSEQEAQAAGYEPSGQS